MGGPEHARLVHHPVGDASWAALLQRYGASNDQPLARVFAVARAHRCRTVVEENRYVDPDYRSEYSAFWSQRFPTRPAFARRLHFFRRLIRDEQVSALDPGTAGYVGYSILKPIAPGRVGRTVLAPPPRLSRATLALATDRVSLFGTPLEVRGAPFLNRMGILQGCSRSGVDVPLLRCAPGACGALSDRTACAALSGRGLARTASAVPRSHVEPIAGGLRRHGTARAVLRAIRNASRSGRPEPSAPIPS